MVNKVLGAYVLADLLFAFGGALMVGFSVVTQNSMFAVPTDGTMAVENLLFQEFPLQGTRTLSSSEERGGSPRNLFSLVMRNRQVGQEMSGGLTIHHHSGCCKWRLSLGDIRPYPTGYHHAHAGLA